METTGNGCSPGGDTLFEPESTPPLHSFPVPVDSEHKSKTFRINTFAAPHMRAFHLSWINFFSCFVSTFAAPPLIPVIRDNLDLTATDIGHAGIASVSGAVFARLVMGAACDLLGPRYASATLSLITAIPVAFMSSASSPLSFLLCRFFIGFSLATFVSTQFWMSSMFSTPVVGLANGFAGGWGNLGGGATQLIMPVVFSAITSSTIGATQFTAWRIAFFIPAFFQTLTALALLAYGQDLPDGNFWQLEKSGEKRSDSLLSVFYHGLKNYRGWILSLTYGYCFGVELTIDNVIAQYFYDKFDLKLHTAGLIAASFGLANVVSRPAGGIISDAMGKRFGMRGRLWSLWIVQTVGGLLCILLGRVGSLAGSIAVMVGFSLFVQAACGLTFGVVPFVSRRSLGVISGMTGGGGNVGAVLTQVLFFTGSKYSKETGIALMGIMIIVCTLPISIIYFPQWGGMFCPPSTRGGATERAYYASEWNSKERDQGFHEASIKFADNSQSERGRRVGSAPTPTSNETMARV